MAEKSHVLDIQPARKAPGGIGAVQLRHLIEDEARVGGVGLHQSGGGADFIRWATVTDQGAAVVGREAPIGEDGEERAVGVIGADDDVAARHQRLDLIRVDVAKAAPPMHVDDHRVDVLVIGDRRVGVGVRVRQRGLIDQKTWKAAPGGHRPARRDTAGQPPLRPSTGWLGGIPHLHHHLARTAGRVTVDFHATGIDPMIGDGSDGIRAAGAGEARHGQQEQQRRPEDEAHQCQNQPRAFGRLFPVALCDQDDHHQSHDRGVHRQHLPPVSFEKQVGDERQATYPGQNEAQRVLFT